MRTHTRTELIAEALGTLITLAVFSVGVYSLLWALAETAEAQYDAADSYNEIVPPKDQDEILNTPDGPCKRRNWSLYLQKCSKVEDTVTVPEQEHFHGDGDTYRAHYEASKQCHAINAWLLESYNWFLGTLGAEHSLTQLYKYSLEASLAGCAG